MNAELPPSKNGEHNFESACTPLNISRWAVDDKCQKVLTFVGVLAFLVSTFPNSPTAQQPNSPTRYNKN